MFNKLSYFNKNKGFTLAEILITLGVIGVVAAMTIPGLIQKNYEKRVISQLRETQSILSQAIRMAEEEYGTADGWCKTHDKECAEIIAGILKPFIKLSQDCGVIDLKGHCVINGNYKVKSGAKGLNYAIRNQVYKVVLLNGTAIWWRGPWGGGDSINGNKHSMMFYVDINGKNKPNTVGIDLFGFEVYPGSGLIPLGSPLSSLYTYEKDCIPKNSDGWGCTYHVIHDKDMKYLHN